MLSHTNRSLLTTVRRGITHDARILNEDATALVETHWARRGISLANLDRFDRDQLVQDLVAEYRCILSDERRAFLAAMTSKSPYQEACSTTHAYSEGLAAKISAIVRQVTSDASGSFAIGLTGSIARRIAGLGSDVDLIALAGDSVGEYWLLSSVIPRLYYSFRGVGLRLCSAFAARAYAGVLKPVIELGPSSPFSWYACHRADELLASHYLHGDTGIFQEALERTELRISDIRMQDAFREAAQHHLSGVICGRKRMPNPDGPRIEGLPTREPWLRPKELLLRPLLASASWFAVRHNVRDCRAIMAGSAAEAVEATASDQEEAALYRTALNLALRWANVPHREFVEPDVHESRPEGRSKIALELAHRLLLKLARAL